MPSYPPNDIAFDEARARCSHAPRAVIASVIPDSPAYDAGFEPGCILTSLDGAPIADIIDWRWRSACDAITVGYIDLDGDAGTVELWREADEPWGFEFDQLIFDRVHQCRNACTFCFMRQLPADMRPALSVRDDDYRLSFLAGTFVTLTNLAPEDEARIIDQRISPLHVSLQAAEPPVRRELMGRHADYGLQALERLLAAGITCHTQVVLVPGVNDGAHLRATLEWAYARPGILSVGIVPLGYTAHQSDFTQSFNDAQAARAVLQDIAEFQNRAQAERGCAWVYAADEFYSNAYRDDLLAQLPDAAFYGAYELFEDGIGIIRSTVDDFDAAAAVGDIAACAQALRQAGKRAYLVAGEAQRPFMEPLLATQDIADAFCMLYVPNEFFGGNVDVTGLLTAQDIAASVRKAAADPAACFFVPRIIFNDDSVTLDDKTLQDMEDASGVQLTVVSCSPKDYFREIARA